MQVLRSPMLRTHESSYNRFVRQWGYFQQKGITMESTTNSHPIAALLLFVTLTACVHNGSADRLQVRPLVKSPAFAELDKLWFVSDDGKLVNTRNGGESWSTLPGAAVGGRFESVAFINQDHGMAVNHQGQLWNTSDGGQSWSAGMRLRTAKSDQWQFMSSDQMKFVDETRGWIVETFTVWRTDDGGNTWQNVFSVLNPETNGQPESIFFLNRDQGWVVTSRGQVYQTSDGGTTWAPLTIATGVSINGVFFINRQTGWASGFMSLPPYEKLYRSDDGGRTWVPLPSLDMNVIINSMSFLNEQDGWAVGQSWTGDTKTSVAAVLHTIDGGKSWKEIQLHHVEPLCSGVHFVDSQHGWLFTRDSVYRTEDSGKNWRIVLKLPAAT
jgi:photosystem II stability/assembly factor-like uncharacterized protein